MKKIEIYSFQGKSPFKKWMSKLNDSVTKSKILGRIAQLRDGHYGDYRYLSSGLFELKLNYGPGYRIYCGEQDKTIIVVLCGGDKGTQSKDIEKAKEYWANCLNMRR